MSTNFDIDCRYFPILADLLFRETFRYKPYFNLEEAGFQIFGSSIVASGKVSWCLTWFYTRFVSGPQLMNPCEVSLCSHKRHRCEVQNGTASCVCNTACTLEYNPVCASDNNTYPNPCGMEVAACQSGERLRVVKPGRCGKLHWTL